MREEDCGTDDHVALPAILDGQLNLSASGRVLADDVHKPLKDGKPGKTVLAEKGRAAVEAARSPSSSSTPRRPPPGSQRAQVPQRGGRVPRLLRHLPRERRHVRDRRRRRHRRGAVDRRAGHAADDADVPHGRCRRRGHHARPPASSRSSRRGTRRCRDARRVRREVEVDEQDRTTVVTVTPSGLDDAGEPLPVKDYSFPRRTRLLVRSGDTIEQGDPLDEGSLSPPDLLAPRRGASRARPRPSCTSWARCRRSTSRRASTSTTSTSSSSSAR